MATRAGGRERRGGRHYLGKATGVAVRQRVYRTREYLEVDEIDGYDVVRKRVFFDDVLLVTYHRFLGWPYLVGIGVLLGVFTLASLAAGSGDARAGLIAFAVSGLPFLVLLVLRLILKVDAVTVFGKRGKAQIQFAFRKARAREVYVQLCRAVREQQDRLARELQKAQPPRIVPAPPA